MGDPPVERAAPDPGDDASTEADGSDSAGELLVGSAALVPDWLVNLAALGWRVLVIAGLVVVAAYMALFLWTITASIIVAIVVAAVFAPLVLRLRSGGRSRMAAAGIAWIVSVGAVLGLLLLLGLAFLPVVVEVLSRVDEGLAALQTWLDERNVPDFVATVAGDAVSAIRSMTADADGGIVGSLIEVGTILVLATFLLFYFLRDGDKAWLWMFQSVGEDKREQITTAGDDALARVGGYLRGTTVLAGLIAISDFVFMAVLGVPYALPLAILVFFGGYIPFFGGVATAAIVLLVTLGSLGTDSVLIMLALFVIRDLVLHFFVRPRFYRRTVNLHPGVTIIALLVGFELAGVIGLVVAVPVTVVVFAVARASVAIVEPDSPPPLPGLVPAWLDRMAQFSWRILVGVGFLALLIAILTTVPLMAIPVLLGMILAATLQPLSAFMLKRGQSPGMAAAVTVVGTSIAVAAALILSMVALVEQADELGDTVIAGISSANDSLGGLLGLPVDAVTQGSETALQIVLDLAAAFGAVTVVAVVSAMLTFYFLRDGGRAWNRLLPHLRADARDDVDGAGTRAFEVLGGYMSGTAVISFVGAASQFVIMVVLGLPLAMPVFVLSFFLSFIPYIGGFISTLIAFMIAVAVGSPLDIVIMFIWTIVFNLVTGSIVAPIVYGKTVHIHPAIVLVAIPAGSTIAGILGMFIVVPALGVVAVTWRSVLKVMGSRKEMSGPEPPAAPPHEEPPPEPASAQVEVAESP